jgi:hypothetical protein
MCATVRYLPSALFGARLGEISLRAWNVNVLRSLTQGPFPLRAKETALAVLAMVASMLRLKATGDTLLPALLAWLPFSHATPVSEDTRLVCRDAAVHRRSVQAYSKYSLGASVLCTTEKDICV